MSSKKEFLKFISYICILENAGKCEEKVKIGTKQKPKRNPMYEFRSVNFCIENQLYESRTDSNERNTSMLLTNYAACRYIIL